MASFVIYLDQAGEFRWYFLTENNRKMADSGEGYRNRQDCEDAIRLIKRRAAKAVIESKAKPVETLIAS